ncbi:MAG: arabinose isomerase, partial [archaeon]
MKVGLFGIGLDTYWPQFDGLLSRLLGYQNQISKEIEAYQVEVVDCGMVDNPTKAKAAADLLKHNDVELVFLYISTYALSSTVLPVIQKL